MRHNSIVNETLQRFKSTSTWMRLRAGKTGATIYGAELIGRLPSKSLRTIAASTLLGMDIHPTAQLYRWKEIRDGKNIQIGAGSIIGSGVTLDGRSGIVIGKSVNFSSEVALWTLQHDLDSPTFDTKGGPIKIGDRAWLSFRCTILPGVEIGEGAVVAAGAVVAKDVEPYTVVSGIPAVPRRARSTDARYDWTNARAAAPWFI